MEQFVQEKVFGKPTKNKGEAKWLETAERLKLYRHSGEGESFNHLRLKYVPKYIRFRDIEVYTCLSELAGLDYNENVGKRAQNIQTRTQFFRQTLLDQILDTPNPAIETSVCLQNAIVEEEILLKKVGKESAKPGKITIIHNNYCSICCANISS